MSLVINSSIPALRAQFDIREAQRGIASSMEALSSGRRVNGAADDAAGLSISTRLETQQRSLAQVVEQAYRGANLVETAEGALNELGEGVQRVRELSLRALNGSLSQQDLVSIQTEITQTIQGMEQIADSTTYNSIPLLSGSEEDLLFEFPLTISADSDDALQVQLPNMTAVEMGIAGGVDNGRVTNEQASTQATLTTQKTGEKFEINVGGTVSEGDVFAFTANGRSIQYEVTIDDINADNPRRQVVAGLIGELQAIFPDATVYSQQTKSIVARQVQPQALTGSLLGDGISEVQQIQMPFGFTESSQVAEGNTSPVNVNRYHHRDVAFLPNGNYLIAYTGYGSSALANKLYVQQFDGSGDKVGSEVEVGQGDHPNIEVFADGNYVVSFYQSGSYQYKYFDEAGNLLAARATSAYYREANLSGKQNMHSAVFQTAQSGVFPGVGFETYEATLRLNVFDSEGSVILENFGVQALAGTEPFESYDALFVQDNGVAVVWSERENPGVVQRDLKLAIVDINNARQLFDPITVTENPLTDAVRLMAINENNFGVFWFDPTNSNSPVLQIFNQETNTLGPKIVLDPYGPPNYSTFTNKNSYVNAEMVSDDLFYLDDGETLHLFDLDGNHLNSKDKFGAEDFLFGVSTEYTDTNGMGDIAYVSADPSTAWTQKLSVERTLSSGDYTLSIDQVTLTGSIPDNSANPFEDLIQSLQDDPLFSTAGVTLSSNASGIAVEFNTPGDREPVVFEQANGEAIGEVLEEVKGVGAGNIVLKTSELVLQNNQYTLTVGDTTLSADSADYADDVDSLYADLVSDPDYAGANFTLTLANQNLVITPSGPIDANTVQLNNATAVQLDMETYELLDEPQLLTIGDQELEVAFESSQEPSLDNLVQQIRSHPDFDQSRFDVFTADSNLSIEFLDGAVLPVHLSNRGLPLTATDFVVENLPSGVGVDVLTHEGAKIAVELSDAALARISMSRGYLGAVLNRIDHSISVNSNTEMNLKSANSRIVDADFAKQSASLVQYQIQTQVSQAMIAQANATHRAVMEILKPIVG